MFYKCNFVFFYIKSGFLRIFALNLVQTVWYFWETPVPYSSWGSVGCSISQWVEFMKLKNDFIFYDYNVSQCHSVSHVIHGCTCGKYMMWWKGLKFDNLFVCNGKESSFVFCNLILTQLPISFQDLFFHQLPMIPIYENMWLSNCSYC